MVFIATMGWRVVILKQVLVLSGEGICMRNGVVYTSDNLACEPYAKTENGRSTNN